MRRVWALIRNTWRTLTSMGTALVLLFLLAIAAIPPNRIRPIRLSFAGSNADQPAACSDALATAGTSMPEQPVAKASSTCAAG